MQYVSKPECASENYSQNSPVVRILFPFTPASAFSGHLPRVLCHRHLPTMTWGLQFNGASPSVSSQASIASADRIARLPHLTLFLFAVGPPNSFSRGAHS